MLETIFNIKNKTVVVTGASGYLGRHMCQSLLEVGAKVILLGRSDKIKQITSDFKERFGTVSVHGFQVDFYNQDQLKQTLTKISNDFNVDVVVNNAYDLSQNTGFNTTDGTLENTTEDMWDAAFKSGIYWAVQTTQIFGKKFKKAGKGNIINISSMYGIVAPSPKLYADQKFLNPPTYGVTKSGIISLTKYTASFWGQYGIRCNAISPGAFPNTESQSSNSVDKDNSTFLNRLSDRTVLGRVGKPKDLIGALILLSSDASDYITGQVLQVDGGWTIT